MAFYNNPANAAQGYLQQVPGAISPYYNPYIGAGQNSLGILQGQYGNLLNNPGGVLNQIGQGYQQSPGFQFQTQQALQAANRAASAGGMLGSPMEQQSIAGTVNGLANQDYNQYLQNAMQMFGQGLQGEQGLNQEGFQASNEMAGDLANNLNSQAQLAYTGQQNQNQHNGGMWGSLFGLAGDAAGSLFGPAGTAVGGWLGNHVGNWLNPQQPQGASAGGHGIYW